MLREGDKVTLSLSVAIPNPLNKYNAFKPHAAVTRTLSDDIEGDMATLEAAVKKEYRRALLLCITEMNDLIEVLDGECGGDLEEFTDALRRQLNVNERIEAKVQGESQVREYAKAQAPKKKKSGRKVRQS